MMCLPLRHLLALVVPCSGIRVPNVLSREKQQRVREISSLMFSRPSTRLGFPPLVRPVTRLQPQLTRCFPRNCRDSL